MRMWRLGVAAMVVAGCGGAPAPTPTPRAAPAPAPAAPPPGAAADPAAVVEPAADPAAPEPIVLSGLYPDTGAPSGGTYVVVQGRHFRREERTAQVRFGTAPATVVRFASDGELLVQAPGGPAGAPVDVVVTFSPGGEHTLPAAFRYVEPAR